MPDPAGDRALLRLMAWLSPAFPIGSFSYSSGLERAVHDGLVDDAATLRDWIGDLLEHGSAWNDAVLFCEAWRRAGDGDDLAELAELGAALAGSLERRRETMLQGEAFLAAAGNWPGLTMPPLGDSAPYCVAVGAVAGADKIPLAEACPAFIQSFASNMIQAAIRLSVLGQAQAVGVLASLEPAIVAMSQRATASTRDDLGSATIMAEIASMKHETQYSRLFRS